MSYTVTRFGCCNFAVIFPSIRKRLAFARDKTVHEYRDVTPLGWGRQFHDQSYVSAAAMRMIADRGGRE